MRLLFRTLFVVLGIAQVLLLVIAAQRPAYAYTDPGSGLLFIQVASSMAAGALFMVRAKLRKLFNWRKDRASQVAGDRAPEAHE